MPASSQRTSPRLPPSTVPSVIAAGVLFLTGVALFSLALYDWVRVVVDGESSDFVVATVLAVLFPFLATGTIVVKWSRLTVGLRLGLTGLACWVASFWIILAGVSSTLIPATP